MPDTPLTLAPTPPSPRTAPQAAPALPEGEALDRLIFSRILALAAAGGRSLVLETGLEPEALRALIDRYAPEYQGRLDGGGCTTAVDHAVEENDLKSFIMEFRGHDGAEADWLAAILARRSLQSNHLWQDMGFAHRGELNAMFQRHFPALKALNGQDMKWKKFFYRQLCEREGFSLCKSPNCEVCSDFVDCFGEEPGDPLSTLAHLNREASQHPGE